MFQILLYMKRIIYCYILILAIITYSCKTEQNTPPWIAVNSGLPSPVTITALAINGNNIFAGTNNGVYLSTNNGTNWTVLNNGLPAINIYALFIYGNNIFAGSYENVSLSKNNGNNWTDVNIGLPAYNVTSFACNSSYVFAGTGNGVYRQLMTAF